MTFFRSVIQNLQAYVPGFQPKESGFIKLNTNENPYAPSPNVLKALQGAMDSKLRLYPDPFSDDLRQAISEVYGVDKDWILIGNGSDEILDMAFRCIVGKGDRVCVTDPTYILYEVLAKFQEAKVKKISLDKNFDLPKKFDNAGSVLTLISNPNTPTGKLFDRTQVEKICVQSKGLVLIDEAYADFADENCLDFVNKFKNVIITRTFSKSYSLAGVRLGCAIARPEVIHVLSKVKDSYNVNRMSQIAGWVAIHDAKWMTDTVRRIIRDREFVNQKLRAMNFEVLPSQANFIFARHSEYPSLDLYQELYRRKILVRHFNRPRLKTYLRISIGTHQEMIKLVKAIDEILAPLRH